jgi:hypothetical protein
MLATSQAEPIVVTGPAKRKDKHRPAESGGRESLRLLRKEMNTCLIAGVQLKSRKPRKYMAGIS